jgi:hypothetical protein
VLIVPNLSNSDTVALMRLFTRELPYVLALGALLIVAGTASGASGAGGDRVWVGGTVHHFVVTGAAPTGAPTTPLYVIAPVSTSHPLHPLADATTHGFGAHDHVIAVPRSDVAFKTACVLTLVVPGARATVGKNVLVRQTVTPFGRKSLVYAEKLRSAVKPLTSAARIQAARQRGFVSLSVTPSMFACTIAPVG